MAMSVGEDPTTTITTTNVNLCSKGQGVAMTTCRETSQGEKWSRRTSPSGSPGYLPMNVDEEDLLCEERFRSVTAEN